MKRMPKRNRIYYLVFLIFLIFTNSILIGSLSACTPEYLTRITLIPNVVWYSENPNLEILILKENVTHGFGYIKDGSKKINIFFTWRDGGFSILVADKYGVANISNETKNMKIHGNYKPKNNDTEADLQITNDNIFGGKYTNQIIYLKYKTIAPNEIDAKYRTNIRWTSAEKNLIFCIGPEERLRGKGQLEYNGTLHNILFYWEDDSKFSIYTLQDDIQSQSPLLEGTYTNSNLNATLTIETDFVLNHKYNTIDLTAEGLDYQP